MMTRACLLSLLMCSSAQVLAQALPAKTEKVETKVPSVLDVPTEVLLSLSRNNVEGIKETILKIWEFNKKDPQKAIQIRLFVPESFEALAEKQKSAVPTTLAKLKKELAKQDKALSEKLEVHQFPYLQYPQIAQLGEPYFQKKVSTETSAKTETSTKTPAEPAVKTWSLAFLDLNPGNRKFVSLPAKKWPVYSKSIYKSELPLEEPHFLRESLRQNLKWEVNQLPVVTQGLEFESPGNRGSNMILLPQGGSLLGDSAPLEMKKLIESLTGKPALLVSTDFLMTRDIEQIFSLLPAKNGCGFVITKSELLWGLQIRKNDSYKGESIEESLFFFRKNNVKPTEWPELLNFEGRREGRRYADTGDSAPYAGEIRFYDDVVLRMLKAQSRIESARANIAKYLVDQKICAKPEFLSIPALPQIIDAQDYLESLGESSEEEKISFVANPPRALVLGENLLISDFSAVPEKYRETLKDATLRQLLKRGYPESQIHFVKGSQDMDDSYGIFGSTLVLRALK